MQSEYKHSTYNFLAVNLTSIYCAANARRYSLYGMPYQDRGFGQEQQPYYFGGKELDLVSGLNWYDFSARHYDDVLGRFTTPDPLAEKRYSISNYAYASGNPINRIDKDGMLDDWYEFDEAGNYVGKTEAEGTDRIMIHSKGTTDGGIEYDSYRFVDFADPVNDVADIENGTINKLVFVSEKDIQSTLQKQGAFDANVFSFAWNSQGNKNFDYSFDILPKLYPDANFNMSTQKSNSLFLPEGDYTAHNFMNYGNYLWGATGYTVGLGYGELQLGAHLYTRTVSRRDGNATWDSKDDQRSIILGAYHAQQHNYREK
ncbi:MAG: RHS repeat-associated core domain-containing protein [Paludibacter sp.]|nr:RHS repeat-associated core domain-containing protein [Paludibacter sp.]